MNIPSQSKSETLHHAVIVVLVSTVLGALALMNGTISVVRAQSVSRIGQVDGLATETIDGVSHAVEYYAGSPDQRTSKQQLERLAIQVASEDRVEVFPDPSLGLGSAITIVRATRVVILDANERTQYRTWSSTVTDLLKERQIILGKDDSINLDKNKTLEDEMTITITRVQVTEIDEQEAISFTKVSVDDPTMDKGQSKVLQAGKNGVRTKTYRIRRENGQQVEKKLIDTETTTEPVTEKTARGTKVTILGSGQATWYALRHGFGAASNVLPYGTKVHVVNTSNGKSVDVTIDDHGIQGSAIIDLDAEAFTQIAPLGAGRIMVRLEKYYGN